MGNRFVSNTIRHTPDMAIYGGGNQAGEEGGCDTLFQDNTIDRAMFETTDTGVSTTACDDFSLSWVSHTWVSLSQAFYTCG